MQADKIIIIHPGSANLRIGRASDLNPLTVLHAIGRKRRATKDCKAAQQPTAYSDTFLPELQESALPEFIDIYKEARQIIPPFAATNERSSKRQRVAASPTRQITTFNKESLPEDISKEKTPKEVEQREIIFDEHLLNLSSDVAATYNIHFPMRRGELNLHNGIGGSMSALLADLEEIWKYAICERMKIEFSALSTHNAVLLVSDIYNRSHMRELVSLLLMRLKFRACFVVQDHVAATFGAGLGYACVVDVGDQKCSISCIDDGISHPYTRLRLPFGGSNVTRVFYTLMQQHGFPYKDCNVDASLSDAMLITRLKERFCTLVMDTNVAGTIQEHTFEVNTANGVLRYKMQLSDECIVAPLAIFHTELLNITHSKEHQVRIQLSSSQQPDAEDCFDSDYIRDTGRRNGMRCDQLEGNMPLTGDNGEDELATVDTYDVESTAVNNAKISEQKADFAYTGSGQVVSLDQAIIRSIERCVSEELKKKMYGCILLVGGGVKVPGFAKFVEKKLQSSTYEVNVFMREMDASMIAWKGAAIMSCLESAHAELWINAAEWEKYGLRVLREKAPFIW